MQPRPRPDVAKPPDFTAVWIPFGGPDDGERAGTPFLGKNKLRLAHNRR